AGSMVVDVDQQPVLLQLEPGRQLVAGGVGGDEPAVREPAERDPRSVHSGRGGQRPGEVEREGQFAGAPAGRAAGEGETLLEPERPVRIPLLEAGTAEGDVITGGRR